MKINSTGKIADKVADVFVESTAQKATTENKVKTGIGGTLDSFIHSPAGKSIAAANKECSGVVAGLKVQVDPSATAVRVDPGLAVDPKGKSLHGSQYFYGKFIDASDLQKDQTYLKGDRNSALLKTGLISSIAGTYMGAVRANAALDRLSTLTGKSTEALLALLNQYGVDAGNPPNPPNDKVNAFLHDPAFAAIAQQELLHALYG